MDTSTAQNSSAASGAAGILRDVFSDLDYGLSFRLWDGTTLSVGREALAIEVAFPSLDAFKRVMLNPSADAFAEAYCDSVIDVEGDLFEVMKVADSMETVELGTIQKFKIALRIWKLSE